MVSSSEALQRLQEGNHCFVLAGHSVKGMFSHAKREELEFGQEPFAIILGCSDSRVPAEIVFDQGLGDLFVIRVAGNVVDLTQIGSVEFAVAQFKARLVVVMGHTQCGAVSATIEEMKCPTGNQSQSIKSIVDRIRPSVAIFQHTDLWQQKDELLHQVVRANIRASIEQLRQGSKMLKQLIKRGELCIMGAEYSLKTGVVEFI